MSYYYLSFADPHKPKGEQFLGATIVEAESEHGAVMKSHRLGLNPVKCEVAILYLANFAGGDESLRYVNMFVPREEILAKPHVPLFEE